jgi:hypothetical protein
VAPGDLVSPVPLVDLDIPGDLGGLDTHILLVHLVHHLLLRYREDLEALVALAVLVFPVSLEGLVLLPLVDL